MVWRVLVCLYVAANVVALVIVNADQSDWAAAAGIMAGASLALGWGTASGWGVVVALLMVPVALPFGETNQFAGGGETDSVFLLAVVSASMSTVLILASAGARVVYNRLRLQRSFRRAAATRTLPPLDSPSAVDSDLEDAAPINTPTAHPPTAHRPTAAHRR